MNVSLFAALVFVTTIVAPALSLPVGYALCSLVILLSRLNLFFGLALTASASSPGMDPKLPVAIPAHSNRGAIGRSLAWTETVKLSNIE